MEMKLTLPLPPSLNEMLDKAKKRALVGNRLLPIIYNADKASYGIRCDVLTRDAGVFPPRSPLTEWRLKGAAFYVHGLRDPIELLAGLKWPVDWLVKRGFVVDDSPQYLKSIPYPEQHIDRKNQRVELEIEPAFEGEGIAE